MGKTESAFKFTLMSSAFWFRDLFRPRKNILKEVGIEPGFQVLDYGCGPGGYLLPLTKLIGKSGKIYALDTSRLAIKSIKKMIVKKHLSNAVTINSDCKTGLPENSLDVILLYDIFHDLKHPHEVLKELHRVLKTHGILSVNDHHLNQSEIMNGLTGSGLFKLSKKGIYTYSFSKS